MGTEHSFIEHSVAPVGYANFLGPNVESLPAYSVHVGDRSAAPCRYCLSIIRQLQPAQYSIVSRKFRRARSRITLTITEPEPMIVSFQNRPNSSLSELCCYAGFWFPGSNRSASDSRVPAMSRASSAVNSTGSPNFVTALSMTDESCSSQQ